MPQGSSGISVTIVGAGAVGTALALACGAAGVTVTAIASRDEARARSLAANVPGARYVPIASAAASASIVLLAVSDSAIEHVASQLVPERGVLVAHTSGFRDIAPLAAVGDRGAEIAGFHPLAAIARVPGAPTMPADHYAAMFRGGVFAIEGGAMAQSRLFPLARALGGTPFAIGAADKPLYHLGASMLAAFSVGLAQIAWDNMRAAGATAEVATRGVSHLLATVAANIGASDTPSVALTGPAARGDVAGVRRHIETARALSSDASALYRAHALHTLEIVRAAGRLDATAAEALRRALNTADNPAIPDAR